TVTYTADGNTENNTSETVEVAPKISKLPRVTDLAADASATGVALTWTEPDIENIEPEPVLEGFEDAEYAAQEYEGWTFVDVDKSPVGTLFYSYEIPGITWRVTPLAFVVLDSDEITIENYQPHSGKHCIASIFNADYSAVNDWAISPELTGDAQTITFWAKSASGNYMDDIEMYYSTGSLDPADFIKVGETVKYVPAVWTEYSFEVPAGAKHFAVRSCSDDGDALLLDDFSFIPAGATADLSIVGYDVYRDGVKITAEPVEECEYTDTETADGEHSYVVVTIYTTGISAPSNAVTLTYDGIADATAAGIAITAGKGTITVTGAEGKLLTVAAADGKLYFNGAAAARQTVAAPAGIYVVKAGQKIAKVAVK
nr:choice-of-anchor J domain-containing protein [Muribaculaceae bacterium]